VGVKSAGVGVAEAGVATGVLPGVGEAATVPAKRPGVAVERAARRASLPTCAPADPGGVPVGTNGVAPAAGVPVVPAGVALAGVAVDVGVPVTAGVAVTIGVAVAAGATVPVGVAVAVADAGIVGATVAVGAAVASGEAVALGVALGLPRRSPFVFAVAEGVAVAPAPFEGVPAGLLSLPASRGVGRALDGVPCVAPVPGNVVPLGNTSGREGGVAPASGVCVPPVTRPLPGFTWPRSIGTPASTEGVTTGRLAPGETCRLLLPRRTGDPAPSELGVVITLPGVAPRSISRCCVPPGASVAPGAFEPGPAPRSRITSADPPGVMGLAGLSVVGFNVPRSPGAGVIAVLPSGPAIAGPPPAASPTGATTWGGGPSLRGPPPPP
jgi:hypothetical protein